MIAQRPSIARRTAALMALGAIVAASLLAGTALAATTTKPYWVDITGHTQGAGTTATLTITIVNNTSPQSIGSANWTLPPAFIPVGLPSPSSGAAGFSGNTLLLRNMNVLPYATYTVSFSAIMPCLAGDYRSAVKAKQSNDFSGPPGNDFTPVFPADNLVTTVEGACELSLSLEGGAQPANAEVGAIITTVTYDPSGLPVKVALLDTNGDLVTGIDVPVELKIGTNPGGGKLSGGAAVDTSGGYATFPNISIDAPGIGYTLLAQSTSSGVTAGPSGEFNIMNLGKICTSGPCSGSTTGDAPQSIYTVDAVAGAAGDRLDIGISLEELDCANYDEQTDVVTFNVFSITETESTRIKTLSMQFRPDPKAPKNTWRVCYSSPENGFVDRDGNTVLPGGHGLLRDCTSATDAPCMVSVSKVGKDIKIILRAPAGDPRSRG